MRLDRDDISEERIRKDAARSNGAALPDFRTAEKLYAGFDHRVFASADIRVDQERLWKLNRDAGIQKRGALPIAENAIHFGQVRASVATQDFARIGSDVGK